MRTVNPLISKKKGFELSVLDGRDRGVLFFFWLIHMFCTAYRVLRFFCSYLKVAGDYRNRNTMRSERCYSN